MPTPITDPSTRPPSPWLADRPLVLVVLSFSAGILIEEFARPWPILWWMGLVACAVGMAWTRGRWTLPRLALAFGLVGGTWHHVTHQTPASDIAHAVTDERMLLRLTGTIAGDLVVDRPSGEEVRLSTHADTRTRFLIELNDPGMSQGWTGRVVVTVFGDPGDWHSGDVVRILGWLSRPPTPGNPGEFDYRRYLARQGTHATMFAQGTGAVQVVERPWSLLRLRDAIREWGANQFAKRLSEESARLASSLVLGVRTALSDEELKPFLESGTVHILVVSGLHVGLTAWFTWLVLGGIAPSLRARAGLTILVVVGYAFVTGGHPPAVRAAILTSILLGEYLVLRTSSPINSLAGSALGVLMLDTNDLFRSGTQLSFLCAFTLLIALPTIWPAREPAEEDDLNPPNPFIARLRRSAVALVATSVLLWVVTAPLIAHAFHLWVPGSVWASMALVPMASVTLITGMLTLLVAPIPILPDIFGGILEFLLRGLTWVSGWTASSEFWSQYVSGPALWWNIGFYSILILPWVARTIPPMGRWHLGLAAVWIVVGAWDLSRSAGAGVTTYHQLAVGHGNAGVLITEEGQTVLFDAGSIRGPSVADQIIAPFLWSQRVRRLDAVMISHADIDHFNGLVRLARMFPIGAVWMPMSMAASTEPAALVVMDEIRRRRLPVRFLAAGDVRRLTEVTIEVLHPPANAEYLTDNASSIVAVIRRSGGSILSTGDVDGAGLDQLLSLPSPAATVFLAPHHGAASSNTPATAAWSKSRLVISSQGRRVGTRDPLESYRELGATTWRTEEVGCVSIRWEPDGGMVARTWRDEQQLKLD